MRLDFSDIPTQFKTQICQFEDIAKEHEKQKSKAQEAFDQFFGNKANLSIVQGDAVITSDLLEWGLYKPFPKPIGATNQAELLKWAIDQLKEKMTCGVDGSQVYPNNEYYPQFGLVHACSFLNWHSSSAKFQKRQSSHLINAKEVEVYPREAIDYQRFALETDMLFRAMSENPKGLFFFDGSLVFSFVRLSPFADLYVNQIAKYFPLAEKPGSSLIGYIDESLAKDVLNLISMNTQGLIPQYNYLSDSITIETWVNRHFKRMQFGDRTGAFLCNRNDSIYTQYPLKIAFFYAKLTSGPLARIEFPASYLETRDLDQLLQIIMGEVIAGEGIPYPLRTMHNDCVISGEDEMAFYRMIQKLCAGEGIPFHISTKLKSKMRGFGHLL